MKERTLVILKPDAVQRCLVGDIISRFERRGLKIVAMKMMLINQDLAKKHYAEHVNKPFYPKLESYITSGPVVVMVLEGKKAVSVVRKMMGETNPLDANPGTIRGDYALEIGRNIVHGSDSLESTEREIALFFSQDELLEYKRLDESVVYEED